MHLTTLARALAVALPVALAGGCASNPAAQTPQQVAAIACPSVQTALASLTALYAAQPALASASAKLAALTPTVTAVCAAATSDSVAQLAATVVPQLEALATSPPLTPEQVVTVDVALTAAQVALATQVAAPASAATK